MHDTPGSDIILPFIRIIMSAKGQIVIPAKFRNQDDIPVGREFDIERVDKGEYRLIVAVPPKNQGLVDTLLACQMKGWFEPLYSDSTDARQGACIPPFADTH